MRWKKTFRKVGVWIGRDHSVVSREVGRNGGREKYVPLVAQRRTDRLRKRPKERKVLKSPVLTRAVAEGLRQGWIQRRPRSRSSQVATLVERQTRHVMLGRIPHDRTAEHVARRLAEKMNTLPDVFKNSVTWDQGKEMTRHAEFAMATGMPVYFCDPHSPWQRGGNENTNGLLRQYLPKGTDLSGYAQGELDAIADELNGCPR